MLPGEIILYNLKDVMINSDNSIAISPPLSTLLYLEAYNWYTFNNTTNDSGSANNDLTEVISGSIQYDTDRKGVPSGATKATSNVGPCVLGQANSIETIIPTGGTWTFSVWSKYVAVTASNSYNPFNIYSHIEAPPSWAQFSSLRLECSKLTGVIYAANSASSAYGSVSGTTAVSGLTAGWHLFTLTNSGNTKKLYYDGSLLDSKELWWPLFFQTATIDKYIIAFNMANNQVDDFAYWNRTLSDAEILALYQET